jgi:hypothetical protein
MHLPGAGAGPIVALAVAGPFVDLAAAGPFVALATAGPFVALATAGPFVALAAANVPNSIPSIDNEPNESPSILSGNDNIERLWELATTAPRMGATTIRNFMVVVWQCV